VTKTPNNEPRRQPIEASIDPTRLYRADEACLRMGWRPSSWRSARRAGLVVHKSGKNNFVLGANLIAHVVEQRGNEVS
jgi:hypothetical protein